MSTHCLNSAFIFSTLNGRQRNRYLIIETNRLARHGKANHCCHEQKERSQVKRLVKAAGPFNDVSGGDRNKRSENVSTEDQETNGTAYYLRIPYQVIGQS